MILVAMDTASGFVLAGVHAVACDAATRTATMARAVGALPVKVVQAVADAVRRHLEQFRTRLYAAEQSGVRPTVLERIAKMQRLVPTWTASLAWWEQFETAQREALGLAAELAAVVRDVVIPWAYLTHRWTVGTHAGERVALDAVLTRVTSKLDASKAWSSLAAPRREALARWAVATVAHFVRTSSCVEGRRGFLSLRYHHRRALPPALLKALTVIHNYVLRGAEGKTAVERLFDIPHADLFEHLLQVIPPLPLPQKRVPCTRRHPLNG